MAGSVAPTLVPEGAELSAPAPTKKKTWIGKLKAPKVKLPAVSDITWGEIWKATKEFLADPINIAVTVWILLSVPACVLIMLIKAGFLSRVFSPQTLEEIDEVATQVVNALFTLMCLIIFPLLCRHTYLLIRWSPRDKVELRQAFCKNGKRKPHDRTHIAVVVFWGQVTCWATFAFAAVYWAFPMGERPVWLVSVTFAISMAAPVISFVYLLLSPLSKDYDIVKEGDDDMLRMYQRTNAFFLGNQEIREAKWNGTVVPGCCANRRIACLVFFFPCCMFGYNMERLGFGHKVVHTLAFTIILIGPVIVFEWSASALESLGLTEKVIYYCGIVLAFCGVMYGGAWRIKMREAYQLPGSRICCWSKRATDVCTWLWCSWCALCQEIRTTDQYQVEETSYSYSQAPGGGDAEGPTIVAPEGDEDLEEGKMSPPTLPQMTAESKSGLA